MNDDYYECLTPETTIAILEVRTLSPLTFSSLSLIFVLRSDLKMFHHFCCTSCSSLLGLFYFYYTVHFIITQYSTALYCTSQYNAYNNNYFKNMMIFSSACCTYVTLLYIIFIFRFISTLTSFRGDFDHIKTFHSSQFLSSYHFYLFHYFSLFQACKQGNPPKMGKWGSLPMNGQVSFHMYLHH